MIIYHHISSWLLVLFLSSATIIVKTQDRDKQSAVQQSRRGKRYMTNFTVDTWKTQGVSTEPILPIVKRLHVLRRTYATIVASVDREHNASNNNHNTNANSNTEKDCDTSSKNNSDNNEIHNSTNGDISVDNRYNSSNVNFNWVSRPWDMWNLNVLQRLEKWWSVPPARKFVSMRLSLDGEAPRFYKRTTHKTTAQQIDNYPSTSIHFSRPRLCAYIHT